MHKNENVLRLCRMTIRSLVVEVVLALLLLLVVAVLISEEILPLSGGRIYAYGALIIGAINGSYLLSRSYDGKKMVAALLNAGMLFVFLIILTLSGKGSGKASHCLMQLLLALTGSIVGCVFAVSLPKRRKRK